MLRLNTNPNEKTSFPMNTMAQIKYFFIFIKRHHNDNQIHSKHLRLKCRALQLGVLEIIEL